MQHLRIQKTEVFILKANLHIKHFIVIEFNMHIYLYMRWRKNKKDGRVAIEQHLIRLYFGARILQLVSAHVQPKIVLKIAGYPFK